MDLVLELAAMLLLAALYGALLPAALMAAVLEGTLVRRLSACFTSCIFVGVGMRGLLQTWPAGTLIQAVRGVEFLYVAACPFTAALLIAWCLLHQGPDQTPGARFQPRRAVPAT